MKMVLLRSQQSAVVEHSVRLELTHCAGYAPRCKTKLSTRMYLFVLNSSSRKISRKVYID